MGKSEKSQYIPTDLVIRKPRISFIAWGIVYKEPRRKPHAPGLKKEDAFPKNGGRKGAGWYLESSGITPQKRGEGGGE